MVVACGHRLADGRDRGRAAQSSCAGIGRLPDAVGVAGHCLCGDGLAHGIFVRPTPLEPGEGGEVKGPTAVGTGRGEGPQVELSRLIDQINERFGTDFTSADELFFNQIREEAIADEELRQAAHANNIENFRFVFDKALETLFIDRMEQNEDLFAKFMNDKDFQKVVTEHLLHKVYAEIREDTSGTAA